MNKPNIPQSSKKGNSLPQSGGVEVSRWWSKQLQRDLKTGVCGTTKLELVAEM